MFLSNQKQFSTTQIRLKYRDVALLTTAQLFTLYAWCVPYTI